MKATQVLTIATLIISPYALADGQCGPFRLSAGPDDGWFRINGVRPETQHVTFLKEKEDYNNIKLEWMMATDQPNTWVGLEYIKYHGKAILNAEWIRAGVTGIDGSRQLATYNCVRVK